MINSIICLNDELNRSVFFFTFLFQFSSFKCNEISIMFFSIFLLKNKIFLNLISIICNFSSRFVLKSFLIICIIRLNDELVQEFINWRAWYPWSVHLPNSQYRNLVIYYKKYSRRKFYCYHQMRNKSNFSIAPHLVTALNLFASIFV